VAGQRQRFIGVQHAWLAAQRGPGFRIVQPGITARHQQQRVTVHPHGQRLGDAAGFNAERGCGFGDRSGRYPRHDYRYVGRVRGQPVQNIFVSHAAQIAGLSRTAQA